MMGYELNPKGGFVGFSRLLNDALTQQEFDDILDLPKPNGIKYVIGEDSDSGLSELDVLSVIGDVAQRDYTLLKNVINSDSDQVHFKPEVSKSSRYRFLNILNKHSQTKLSNYTKEAALRNSVVYKINTLLRNARLSPLAHKSVDDSMALFRNIAKKSMLAATELSLSSDNPLVKFLMQTQNMVGKDVIGITAVGMKVFFGVTTALNQTITDLVEHIKTKDFVSAQSDFQNLLFKDPITGQDITLANLNFEPLLNLLNNLSEQDRVEVNSVLGAYLDELPRVIEQSQHTDAAEAISGLLSAATDFCSNKKKHLHI